MSFSSTPLNGCVVFHSGWSGASAFTRSNAKASWKYTGCSDHSVPSLSKTATRSETGTNVSLPSAVTFRTKSMMACFALPSFQDGRASAARPIGLVAVSAVTSAQANATTRVVTFIVVSSHITGPEGGGLRSGRRRGCSSPGPRASFVPYSSYRRQVCRAARRARRYPSLHPGTRRR